jgi:hypothetical protein
VLGAGSDSFYADPPVAHLDLWQFPDRASGFRVQSSANQPSTETAVTAIAFIAAIICQYAGALRASTSRR